MTTELQRQRILAAKRAGTKRRLVASGISEATAEAWLAAWETVHGEPDWEAAWAWALGQWASGKRPPPRA